MSHVEKLYFSRPISNKAAGTGGNFDDNRMATIHSEEDIKQFVDSATRPIRARQSTSRPDMICLYQIGHFEHLLEKLGFVFYDNQQRRRDAHFAIETCIRPRLDQEESGDNAARLEKVHALVEQRGLTCSPSPSANKMKTQIATTHQNKGLELSTSHTVGNSILVPNGISIVEAKASDVIAERIVRAAHFTPGLNMQILSLTKVEQEDGLSSNVDDHDIAMLSNHIKEQLEEADDANLIVFEMTDENDQGKEVKNWKAAYDAAKKVRQASGGKKSIMLVPSAKVFEPDSGNGSCGKTTQGTALEEIRNLLNQSNKKQHKLSNPSNPYACLDEY